MPSWIAVELGERAALPLTKIDLVQRLGGFYAKVMPSCDGQRCLLCPERRACLNDSDRFCRELLSKVCCLRPACVGKRHIGQAPGQDASDMIMRRVAY